MQLSSSAHLDIELQRRSIANAVIREGLVVGQRFGPKEQPLVVRQDSRPSEDRVFHRSDGDRQRGELKCQSPAVAHRDEDLYEALGPENHSML